MILTREDIAIVYGIDIIDVKCFVHCRKFHDYLAEHEIIEYIRSRKSEFNVRAFLDDVDALIESENI